MRLKIEYMPTDQLQAYEGNAKLHPAEQVEQIKKSIEEFGFDDPIAIGADGKIIEGHGRLIAALELGLDKVPVIRLNDLTDEQRRAYALVHNQLTMNSGFDPFMLAEELDGILDIDMSEFGFDDVDLIDGHNDEGYYGDERERTNRAYNLDFVDPENLTADFWQMPIINKDGYIPKDLIGFNYAKTSEEKHVGIHFYVDDYQFERVWNYPEKYTDILREYDCILSPDFSLYMDMPMPMKIWNIYRSRFIGAYYQKLGIKVIPTISWAKPATFEFCFQGIPKHSIVSVSTVGVKNDENAMQVWRDGMYAMIEKIDPEAILMYGGELEFDNHGINIISYENKVTEEWHKR